MANPEVLAVLMVIAVVRSVDGRLSGRPHARPACRLTFAVLGSVDRRISLTSPSRPAERIFDVIQRNEVPLSSDCR